MERKMPNAIPCVEAGTHEYEMGFPADSAINLEPDSDFLCGICKGVPRNPIELSKCGHFFCNTCILVNLRYRGTYGCGRLSQAPCPLCRILYDATTTRSIDELSSTLRRLYNNIKIKCPFGCEVISHPRQIDEHQLYHCPKRKIHCPNYQCAVILPAAEMETHYAECERYRTYCPSCFLPVLGSNYSAHNCQTRLMEALQTYKQYFMARSREIPTLCKDGEPETAVIVNPPFNRLRFLNDIHPDPLDEGLGLSALHRTSSPNPYVFDDSDNNLE